MSFFYIISANAPPFDLWHPSCSSITTLFHIDHSVYTSKFNAMLAVPYSHSLEMSAHSKIEFD